MSSGLNVTIGLAILLAVAILTNVLCWLGMYRGRADRPWHWTVLVGSFAYHPWLNRQEKREATDDRD